MVSLFTTELPALTNENDGGPGYSLGTGMRFTVAGQITAVRYYSTTSVGGTYTVGVFQSTADDDGGGAGTLLQSAAAPVPTPGAWNIVPITAIVVTPNTVLYRPTLHNTQGRYVATSGFFNSPLTNGPIEAYQNGADPVGLGGMRNGSVNVGGSLTYPDSGAPGAACYFVDVVFEPDGEDPAEGSAAVIIDLALASTGARVSAGSAALGLDLAAAGTGGRRSQGTAALGLALTVASGGSSGGPGCPVETFPFTPRAVTGGPVPRPVASFPGGECA